jgi:hypothetical protein
MNRSLKRSQTPLVYDPVGGLAHLIQTALTPVFLLSGIGTLLQLFNTRLARVADHMDHTTELLRISENPSVRAGLQRHQRRFRFRMWLLDASIALGAVGGASSCGAAVVLFLGGVRNAAVDSWLIGSFALALGCTVGSLMVFLGDSALAWQGLRRDGHIPRDPRAITKLDSGARVSRHSQPDLKTGEVGPEIN